MRKKCLSLWLGGTVMCFVGLAVCCPAALRAEILPVTVDAYIDNRSANVNTNYGRAWSLKVFTSPVSDQYPNPARSLIALPAAIGAISADDLASAKLWVYTSGATSLNGRDIELHPLTRSFVEGTGDPSGGHNAVDGATWNTYDGHNAWTTPGGDYAAEFVSINQNTDRIGWSSFDITSMLKGAYRDNLLDYGLLLKVFDDFSLLTTSTSGQNFVSSNHENRLTQHPYFEVTAVPEPSTCLLLLMGSAVMARVARRRVCRA